MIELDEREIDERKFQYSLIKFQVGFDFATNILFLMANSAYALVIGGFALGLDSSWGLVLIGMGAALALFAYGLRIYYQKTLKLADKQLFEQYIGKYETLETISEETTS